MSPPDRIDEFVRNAQQAFPQLDRTPDGKLTRHELAQDIADPNIKGSAAQAAALLYLEYEELKGAAGKTDEKEGLTTQDIAGAGRAMRDNANSCSVYPADFTLGTRDATIYALREFNKYSKDKPGINKDEIVGNTPGAIYLRDHFDQMLKDSDPKLRSLPKPEIDAHAIIEAFGKGEKDCGVLWKTSRWLDRADVLQNPETSRELFADVHNPLKSITPEAIRQGAAGDCIFLSSLASVAAANPDSILRMIKKNEDGSFTVTFPGDKAHPQTVPAPTDAELILYNGASKYGIWAAVMERAYFEYSKKTQNLELEPDKTLQESVDEKARVMDMFKLLTGHNTVDFDLKRTSQQQLSELLETAKREHRPMTAGINPLSDIVSGNYEYPVQHEYSILDFNPNTAGGGTVTVRNPWAKGQGPLGTSELTVEEFKKIFSVVLTTD